MHQGEEMRHLIKIALLAFLFSCSANASEYKIDTKGTHAFINFKASHLGFSWLHGRFNDFEGSFNFVPDNMAASSVKVTIDTKSVDTNHAERDKHLRSDDFLAADKFPQATFVSTKVVDKGEGKFDIVGNFTLHGVTKEITINAHKVGEGKDPWGGYRAGFMGTTEIDMADFDFKKAWGKVQIDLHVEGVRQ
jgi:polyisoprenoid-binding protein YceI